MSFRQAFVTAALAAAIALLSGCAIVPGGNPPPPPAAMAGVTVIPDFAQHWPMPSPYVKRLGDVVVTGHEGNTGFGSTFGLLGELFEAAASEIGATGRIGGLAEQLSIDLDAEARRVIEAEVRARPELRTVLGAGPEAPRRFEFGTVAVLGFLNRTDAHPTLGIEVTLRDGPKGRKQWRGRYFSAVPMTKPIKGVGSWSEDGCVGLRRELEAALRRLVPLMLADLAKPFPRRTDERFVAEGFFPPSPERMRGIGYVLWEDDTHVLFDIARRPDVWCWGVHLLAKTDCALRKANDRDYVMDAARNEPP